MMDTAFEQSVLQVSDLMKILKIGKSKAYALMHSSNFPSTKLGNTYFITYDNFQKWLVLNEGKEISL